MDRILKPKNLEVLPSESEAASIFKHWLSTFRMFVEEVTFCHKRSDAREAVNRKGILINFLSPAVYPYVEDCASYEALMTLEAA